MIQLLWPRLWFRRLRLPDYTAPVSKRVCAGDTAVINPLTGMNATRASDMPISSAPPRDRIVDRAWMPVRPALRADTTHLSYPLPTYPRVALWADAGVHVPGVNR